MPSDLLNYFSQVNASYLHAFGEAGTEQLIAKLQPSAGDKILEIGFGTGATLVKMKSRFPMIELHGIDASPLMYERAQARLQFCGLQNEISLALESDPLQWKYPDNTFDKIYMESVLGIQNDAQLLICMQRLYAVLKPGGKLVINETVWLPEITQEEIEAINKKCIECFGIIQSSGLLKNLEEWMKKFQEYGFTIIESSKVQKGKKHIFSWYLIDNLSNIFSLRGKIKSGFNTALKKEMRQYNQKMSSMFGSRKYMEGVIMVMQKPSSHRHSGKTGNSFDTGTPTFR